MSAERLSEIQTLWSVVQRAHGEETAAASDAQQLLLDRYGSSIQRYLLGAFRDQTAADDAYQEFALRFLRGDYKSADPDRGRFRGFLKTILYRLVVEHHRGQKRRNAPQLASEHPEPAVFDESMCEEDFQKAWRNDMLQRAWDGLEAIQEQSKRPLFTVMRVRVEHPQASSSELAERLSEQTSKQISSANVRVILHRARDEFARLLFQEVADTMENPTRERVEEELIELGLLEYCRPALQRMTDES